jgi:site-specific DNA recombinase
MAMQPAPAGAPTKAAIYIRWSTEDQGEGTTLDVQLEGCRHYALSQGWQVAPHRIYIDDGYSGATLDRPALTRLREAVRHGEVDCVVVYKLDRLSRSVADTARLCMDEWDSVCCVRSAREPIDTQTQAGRMFFYTLMNYAEWERSVIRDRTHSGRVRRAQEGRSPGITCPYGYEREAATGRFVQVPHEAAVVRRLFDAYRAGAGLATIVQQLNREGVPFRGGRRWQVGTVAYLLANRAYMGELVWGRRMRNPRRERRPGERAIFLRAAPLARAEGSFPPIVTAAEFDEVQAIRRQRPTVGRGSGRSHASIYLLTGLLRCGLCGRPLAGAHSDPRRAGGIYYSCTTRRSQGKAVCPAPHIPCHVLDSLVAEQVLARYGRQEAVARSLAALQGEAASRLDGLRTSLSEAERQMARLFGREERLFRQYQAEELTLEEFRRLRAIVQADLPRLKRGA